jgi:hypothetical protein
MGWMHLDHARARCRCRCDRGKRRAGLARLSGVSAAIGLIFDKPFGEMNQHPLGSMIP